MQSTVSSVASRRRAPTIGPDKGLDEQKLNWLGFGLIVLGAGLATNALLGPLVTDVVRYPISESVLNETLGLEVVSLALVAPLAMAAGMLSLRGHRAAPVLAFGPSAYSLYIFVQYVLGPQYPSYPAIMPLHVGMFVLAGAILIRAWSSARATALPRMSARSEKRWARLLLGLAAFVLSRYLSVIGGIVTGDAIPGEYGRDATFYWTMFLMDLGIVVPVSLAAGVALLRGRAWGRTALYAILGWFALLPASVAAMSITKVVNEDPAADVGTSAMFVAAAAVFVAVAIHLYRPMFRPDR